MATAYKNGTDIENEKKYLNSLISQGGGNAEWAKQQMTELNNYASAASAPQSASTTSTTPTTNEHAAWIEKTNAGGLDAYTKVQNDRYLSALQNNDIDLLNRLQADSARVGYTLNAPTVNKVNPLVNNVNPFATLLEENKGQYNTLLKQYQDLINANVNRNTANLEAQKGTINQSADEMARQAYIVGRQNVRALPQQLASRGMTGGATETAKLGLQTNYENNLNNININRANALNAIDTQITDTKNQGNVSLAEQTIANNQAALEAYRNILNNSVNYDQWQTEFNANRQDKLTANANATKQQEFNNIITRLEMGLISPNDAVTLGLAPEVVQTVVNSRKQATTNKNTSTTPNIQSGVVDTAIKHLSNGDRNKAIAALASVYSTAQIKAFLEENGVRTDDIDWGIEAQEAPQNMLGVGNYTTQLLVNYYKSKGYTDQQIANILNKQK